MSNAKWVQTEVVAEWEEKWKKQAKDTQPSAPKAKANNTKRHSKGGMEERKYSLTQNMYKGGKPERDKQAKDRLTEKVELKIRSEREKEYMER